MPPRTLQILLAELIDYAGLFPPAALSMTDAVAEYARQHDGEFDWILGRFVVPAARLDEFETTAEDLLPRAPDAAPWRLSALVDPFDDDHLAKLKAFNAAHDDPAAGAAVVDAVEMKAADENALDAGAKRYSDFQCFFEIDHTRPDDALMAGVAEVEGSAKIRTGGVEAAAFPSPLQVARFIRGAVRHECAFKATAGLHHPMRGRYRLTYETDSAESTMFGFLNVFLAAAFARADLLDRRALDRLLQEADPAAFLFTDDTVTWQGHELDEAELTLARHEAAVSYGSCSFAEPIDELRQLSLL